MGDTERIYNIELINRYPDSIFAVDPGSCNYKFWRLFAESMDELEELFLRLELIPDINNMAVNLFSGEVLDLMGKILREKRMEWEDSIYIVALLTAMRKYSCNGTIEDLNDICRLLLDNGDEKYFIHVRDLNDATSKEYLWFDGSFYFDGSHFFSGDTDNPDRFWLDSTYYLDGNFYLSGDVYQPAFFEIVTGDIEESLAEILYDVIRSCKGSGVKFRIRKVVNNG